jgi:hypothetical protein
MSALLLTLALAAGSSEVTDEALAERAEALFARGLSRREAGDRGASSFRAAAAAYEELRRRGHRGAPLYRNLGNAYLLAGDLPRAVLAYRLGLRLAPGDRALREGLAAARGQVAYAEGSAAGRPRDDPRPPWLAALRPAWLFLAAALAYAGACLSLTRWRMLRRDGFLAAGLLLLAAALPPAGLLAERWREGPPRRVVVVARDGVLLRKGNGLTFPPWFDTPLNRGVEAELLYERGGWLQVELPGGEVGWLRAADAVVE